MGFTIVVGYDGSDAAKAALDEAVGLAGPVGGTVLVAYAYGGRKQYAGAPLTPRRQLRDLGEKLLDEALARVSGSEARVEPVLVDDDAWQGLRSVALQHEAAMIVVGTHGESPLTGMLLGSTAYRLVHSSTTPVLIVPQRGLQAGDD
jgi:nucleotide-binding universal stress UspA family protein